MRRFRFLVLAIALLPGCAFATRLPPEGTFDESNWAVVQRIPLGTPIEVRYTAGGPRPLNYSFDGLLVSVSPEVLEIVSRGATQRLLPHRVRRVALITKNKAGGAGGAMAGTGLGFLICTPMARAMSEQTRFETVHFVMATPCAAVGALVGALVHRQVGHRARDVVYERR